MKIAPRLYALSSSLKPESITFLDAFTAAEAEPVAACAKAEEVWQEARAKLTLDAEKIEAEIQDLARTMPTVRKHVRAVADDAFETGRKLFLLLEARLELLERYSAWCQAEWERADKAVGKLAAKVRADLAKLKIQSGIESATRGHEEYGPLNQVRVNCARALKDLAPTKITLKNQRNAVRNRLLAQQAAVAAADIEPFFVSEG